MKTTNVYKFAAVKEYADVVAQIEQLTAKKEELSMQLITQLHAEGLKTLKTPFGTVSMSERTTYTYPKRIELLKLALEQEREKAVAMGKATIKAITPYIRFTSLTAKKQ